MYCEKCGKYSGKYPLCKDCYHQEETKADSNEYDTDHFIFDMDNLNCPICGESTSIYMGNARKDRLCRNHAKMLKNGEIKVCEKCGKWHNTDETCECENASHKNEKEETHCVVCGENSYGKPQCKNCYYETKDFIDSLDKNKKIRDYYYNLKERILIIKSLEETQKQCNKLIAIAMVADLYHDDTSLIDRVYKDVDMLIKNKKAPIPNDKFEDERKEKDEYKAKINTAQDGHNVDSDMEVHIDDVLYNSYILHCYGKNIDEITEKRKKCDWFIPIVNGKGIYIEYWGMKTSKYLAERKEKEELYQKHNIPYISIEADDPKKDTLTFKNNLLRDLRTLAEKHYGFMPEWKK